MNKEEREQIIAMMNREVVPAIGCTEPIAVALAVAKATEVLSVLPERIDVFLSANMLKNAMGVGIPGTGMVGLPIAIALGALIGKSNYLLEVLKDTTPEAVEKGKQYIAENRIHIAQKTETAEKLYIEVRVQNGSGKAKVIISHDHTNFTWISKNDEVILDMRAISYKDMKNHPLIKLIINILSNNSTRFFESYIKDFKLNLNNF